MTYVVWYINQWQKMTASKAPVLRLSQYQRLSRPFCRRNTPVIMTIGQAAIPIKGFGNPKAFDCGELITEPQLMIGFRSQMNCVSGFSSSWIFSIVIMAAAAKPSVPQMIKSHGKTFSRVQCFMIIFSIAEAA